MITNQALSCKVKLIFFGVALVNDAGYYYYRPQMKFAKVMFSQVSVCPQGGVCHTPAQCMLGYGQQGGSTHPTGMHSCSTNGIMSTKSFFDKNAFQ